MSDTGQSTPTTVPGTSTTVPGQGAFGGQIPGYVPSGTTQEEKRYSSAIGVEGRRITDVKTGKTTYEGTLLPSQTQRIASALPTPYVPNLPTRTVEPTYFQQDLDNLSSFSRQTIASWQVRMNAAGLLGNEFALGVVDNQTRSAYGEVLAVANRETVTAEQALGLIQQQHLKIKTGTGVKRYRISNPADIKAVINQSAKTLLGRSLDDNQLDAMVKAFQAQEVSAQKQYEAGGVAVEAPSVQQFAQKSIEKDFGKQVDTRKLNSVFGAVHNMLIGGKQ